MLKGIVVTETHCTGMKCYVMAGDFGGVNNQYIWPDTLHTSISQPSPCQNKHWLSWYNQPDFYRWRNSTISPHAIWWPWARFNTWSLTLNNLYMINRLIYFDQRIQMIEKFSYFTPLCLVTLSKVQALMFDLEEPL